MATISTQFDILGCKKKHLGPLLLGLFLSQGYLKLRLTEPEKKRLEEADRCGEDATGILATLFCAAAGKCGLEYEMEDWNYSCDIKKREFFAWDPSRMPHAVIA